jgi:type IV secretory pathway ATPase VirB11/archaellum biosynthesis ATPase
MSDIVSRQLNWLLRPIQSFLDDPTVTDIHINGPDPDGATTTLFVKQGAKRSQHKVPLTLVQLENIADNAAALMRQDIAEDAPFCATRLPGGQRVQIVRPPAVPEGRYAMAIRRPSAKAATIQQLIDNGVFSEVRSAERVQEQPRPIVRELLALKAAQRWPELIALAIRNGFNVVWAGMVGTGKTYDLRAFLERSRSTGALSPSRTWKKSSTWRTRTSSTCSIRRARTRVSRSTPLRIASKPRYASTWICWSIRNCGIRPPGPICGR